MPTRPVVAPARAGRGPTTAAGAVYAFLAFLAYVPVLTTARGQVSADSKQYLFLDPGRLLDRAPWLWQPEVHLGTVTHQNIGYLFPAGPWFWAFDRLGLPDWVAQRLWLGTILFAAGVGVMYLLRTLDIGGPGRPVAAVLYMASPYTLAFSSRLSVLLLAWSMLPWLLALTIRALRSGDWRAPAGFALLVQVAGSINLTALVFVGLGPVLWIGWATFVTREVNVRRALATTGRIGLLTIATSAWWLAALSIQAGWGLNILDYSETVRVVSLGGHAGEVLRGLGNWFFYGGDKLGNWIEASVQYTTDRPLIVTGYALATLVFVAAAVLRWRERGYFVALVVVGALLAVGVHPYDGPSPFGGLLQDFAEGSSMGLALRNVARALPLAVLGGAVLVGVAVTALSDRQRARGDRWGGWVVAGAVVALAVVNLPALWNGTFYGENLLRPEAVPEYWTEAIADLDARGEEHRILELPGADFAGYTWGNAVEPITPGLTDRPYVARELIPYGSPASANLVAAIDRRLQMGLLEPAAVAPLARLLSVGDVVVRSDLEVDRFDLARPREVATLFDPVPAGLGAPDRYGDGLGVLTLPLLDARALATAAADDPAPVEVYPVDDPRGLVSAHTGPGLVVSGDGDGIVDLAALGLLDADPLVRYSASAEAIEPGAVLVVTDTNRRRARRWESLRDNTGYTERPGEVPAGDPFDNRLEVFPGTDDRSRTVMEQRGATVTASGYATRHISYLPADRPARAVDGDVATAWRVGRFGPVVGEWLRIEPREPVRVGEINVVQPLDGDRDRFITRVRLEFSDADGRPVGEPVVKTLGPASRTPAGETLSFEPRRFSRVDLVVEADNVGEQTVYLNESAVGFAEVRIPGVTVDEVVRMPVDLVRRPGARGGDHVLVYAMTRLRNRVAPPNIAEEEASLVRSFEVPAPRGVAIAGQARLANTAADDVVDLVLGYPGPSEGGVAARSSDRIRTTLAARASSAIDGDPATAWTSDFGTPGGQWIEVVAPAPVELDRLDLVVVADGRHSVPTRVRVEAGGDARVVAVPQVVDSDEEGATQVVPLRFAPLRGERIRVTVEEVRAVETPEYYSNRPVAAPTAIAELGIPGVRRGAAAALVPDTCHPRLLDIDGQPVGLRLVGSVADAEAGDALAVEECGAPGSADGTSPNGERVLVAGEHLLRAAPGAETGIDLDRVVVASDAAGRGLALTEPAAAEIGRVSAGTQPPRVRVTERGRTRIEADVRGVSGPFVLVLGQSVNEGWRAHVDGRSLGEPTLVDGYANGWRVDPGSAGAVTIELEWIPQRRIWFALGLSAIAILACVALLVAPRRRRRPDGDAAAPVEPVAPVTPVGAVAAAAPAVAWPGEGGARRAPVGGRATVVTALATAAVSAIVAAPWIGVVVGALVALALRRPALRWLPSVVAVAAVASTGIGVLVLQTRHRYPAVIEWPTFFDDVHGLALLAIALVGADVVARIVAERAARGRRSGPASEPPSEPEVAQAR